MNKFNCMLVLRLLQILYLIVINNYLISGLSVSCQSIVLLVQFRVKVQRHWIGLISFQFLVIDGYTEQISKGRSGHIPNIAHTRYLKSESFIFLPRHRPPENVQKTIGKPIVYCSWRENGRIIFQVFSIQKITDMLSLNHSLSLCCKQETMRSTVKYFMVPTFILSGKSNYVVDEFSDDHQRTITSGKSGSGDSFPIIYRMHSNPILCLKTVQSYFQSKKNQ